MVMRYLVVVPATFLGALLILGMLLVRPTESGLLLAVSVGVSAFIASRAGTLYTHNTKKARARREAEMERIKSLSRAHRSTLERKLVSAVMRNDYDVVIKDRRQQVLDEFLVSMGADLKTLSKQEAVHLIFAILEDERAQDEQRGFRADTAPSDGHDFERWVSEALGRFGWTTKVTKGSGDQGIDVIAERHGFRIGIQCKRYRGPVGNKAVQEAHAGRTHYRLDCAAVLSTTGYTSGAKDLAVTTGVLLLSHYDIPQLSDIINRRVTAVRS